MIYKVITAPMIVSGTESDLSDYFQKIINSYARDGWRFYSMETATYEQSAGCALLNIGPSRTNCNLLIFCKPEAWDEQVNHSVPSAPVPPSAVSSGSNVGRGSAASEYVPRPVAQPAVVSVSQWRCSKCGAANKDTYGMCKKCGTYRGSI